MREGSPAADTAWERDFYRLIADSANDWVYLQDPGGRITYMSPSSERITGYAPDAFYGDPALLLAIVRAEDRPLVAAHSREALVPGTQQRIDFRITRRDGQEIWIGQGCDIAAGPDGRTLYRRATNKDITERKQAEAALRLNQRVSREMEEAWRQSEEKFAKAFHGSPDAVTLNRLDDGMYIEINRGFTRILGYTTAETIGRTSLPAGLSIWVSQDDRARLLDTLRAREEVSDFEAPFRARDGSVRHGLMSATIIDIAGVKCILAITRDITDRKKLDDAIRESEARYRRLFDDAIEGIVIADPLSGIIQDCNKAFLRLSGWERGQLVGQHQGSLHPRRGGDPGVSSSFALHRAELRGQVLSDQILTRSGAVRDVEIKADMVEIGGRSVLQGFFRDVTDDLRVRREREGTLALLRLLSDTDHAHELVGNLTGYLREWTGCAVVAVRLRDDHDLPSFETGGLPEDDVRPEGSLCAETDTGPMLAGMFGRVLQGRFDPSLPFFTTRGSFWTNAATELLASATEAERQSRGRSLCGGEACESVALIPLRHGREVLGLIQVSDPARGKLTSEMVAFLESAADQVAITLAQRQSQAALAASERRFRDVSEAAGEFIWECDLDGRLTYVSDRVEEMLGYSPRELLGRDAALPRGEGTSFRSLLESHADERGGFRDLELPLATRTGQGAWLSITAVPLLDAQGRCTGYRGVSMDITERKRLAEQLRQAQKLEAIGQLAGGIAHDFNNLLQVILGNVDNALFDVPHDSAVGQDLLEAARAGQKAAQLTRQLLAFSRRQVLQTQNLDLNEVLGEMIRMLRRLLGEHIELVVRPGVGLGTVRADRLQLEQVLMNLCVNSRDAMPTGGTLTIETESVVEASPAAPELVGDMARGRVVRREESPRPQPQRFTELRVSDTGQGMDEATLARVFEPFFTTKEQGRGTGLGLAMVYGIVKQHGGSIDVESGPGKGACFRIRLPVVDGPAAGAETRTPQAAPGGTERLLVCEDEPAVLRLVTRLLQTAGYSVVGAHDGEEALRVFEERAGAFDLALLDVLMPKMGGRMVMERIRALAPGMRFLFTSGYSETSLHTGLAVDDGSRMIRKPYQRHELLRAVREALDGSV